MASAAIADALRAAKFGTSSLSSMSKDIWQQRLSGGEQQRLAIARAILARPDWLFLDEATTAMDEAMEASIYEVFAKILPATTIVSIGHRASLAQFHKRHIEMTPAAPGNFHARGRSRSNQRNSLVLRRIACQSYQNVSRETFWYDCAPLIP